MKKILYFCSLVPFQYLSSLGLKMISAYDLENVSGVSKLPTNLCSFVRHCERVDYAEFDGVVVTNCCNSTQRLLDLIRFHYPELYTYTLEVPHSKRYAQNITNLVQNLCIHFAISQNGGAERIPHSEAAVSLNGILVIATSLHKSYAASLREQFCGHELFFETCSSKAVGDTLLAGRHPQSCPRMFSYVADMERKIEAAKAVLYIAPSRCDHALFAYPSIKAICEKWGKKCLFVEEEYTPVISGRSRLRYEAFRECLELKL